MYSIMFRISHSFEIQRLSIKLQLIILLSFLLWSSNWLSEREKKEKKKRELLYHSMECTVLCFEIQRLSIKLQLIISYSFHYYFDLLPLQIKLPEKKRKQLHRSMERAALCFTQLTWWLAESCCTTVYFLPFFDILFHRYTQQPIPSGISMQGGWIKRGFCTRVRGSENLHSVIALSGIFFWERERERARAPRKHRTSGRRRPATSDDADYLRDPISRPIIPFLLAGGRKEASALFRRISMRGGRGVGPDGPGPGWNVTGHRSTEISPSRIGISSEIPPRPLSLSIFVRSLLKRSTASGLIHLSIQWNKRCTNGPRPSLPSPPHPEEIVRRQPSTRGRGIFSELLHTKWLSEDWPVTIGGDPRPLHPLSAAATLDDRFEESDRRNRSSRDLPSRQLSRDNVDKGWPRASGVRLIKYQARCFEASWWPADTLANCREWMCHAIVKVVQVVLCISMFGRVETLLCKMQILSGTVV